MTPSLTSPGLIEGASIGRGLGDEFLRHVERNKVLVHLIDPTFDAIANGLVGEFDADVLSQNSLSNYKIIRKELEDYKSKYQALTEKQEIVVINKIDITEVRENFEAIKGNFKALGLKVFGISAFTGEGTEELLDEVYKVVESTPAIQFEKKNPVRIINIQDLKNKRFIFNISDIDEAKSNTAAL